MRDRITTIVILSRSYSITLHRYTSTCVSVQVGLSKENNCLQTPYRSKFTAASRGFSAIARFCCL